MHAPLCILLTGAVVALTGCGDAPKAEVKKPAVTISDETRMLPPTGLKHSEIELDHVLGIAKLPGGTAGDYESGGRKYQIFIVDAATNQEAAFLLLDFKSILKDPEYLSSYGGYFGSDGARPVFVFAKQRYVAGISGLSKDEADPVARVLASRLK